MKRDPLAERLRRPVHSLEIHERSRKRLHAADQIAEIAVRAYTEPARWKPARRRPKNSRWPKGALILTTVAVPGFDLLWFGVWAFLFDGRPVERGCVYREGLSSRDIEAIKRWAFEHDIAVHRLDDFFKRLFKLTYKKGYRIPLVAWRLPEHLARLAAEWRPAEEDGFELFVWTQPDLRRRSRKRRPRRLRNGQIENPRRPRIQMIGIGRGRAIIQYRGRWGPDERDRIPEGSREPEPKYQWRGRFVDLSSAAFSLTGNEYDTIEEAAAAFDIECAPPAPSASIEEQLNRALPQNETAGRLFMAVQAEQAKHSSVDIQPHQLHSPSGYARAYLEAAGLDPLLHRWPDFPKEFLAKAMAAYHGGENRIGLMGLSGIPLPVITLDFTGGYGMSAVLAGVWDVLTAESVEIAAEDPDDVGTFVADLAKRVQAWIYGEVEEDPLTPEEWRRLSWTLADVAPDADVLPHRRRTLDLKAWRMHVGPLTCSERTIPFVLTDVLRSTLETGRIPEIRSASRLITRGLVPSIQDVRLPDGTVIRGGEDLVLALLEFRRRLALRRDVPDLDRKRLLSWAKVVVSAMVAGNTAQVDERTPGKGKERVHIWASDGSRRTLPMNRVEEPGPWFFSPIAAAVTAGQRLLLYLARAQVERVGGTVLYEATDSLAVLASAEIEAIACPGGRERVVDLETGEELEAIRIITHEVVETVRKRMEVFSRYAREHRPGRLDWVSAELSGLDRRGGLPRRVARGHYVPVEDPILLKLETENFRGSPSSPQQVNMWAVSPMRAYVYTVTERGTWMTFGPPPTVHHDHQLEDLEVVKASEQSLGQLLPPPGAGRDWIAQAAEQELKPKLGLVPDSPSWLDEPALALVTTTVPGECVEAEGHDRRPWTTIVLGRPDPIFGPARADGTRIIPASIWYEGFNWRTAEWFDFATGERLPGVRVIPDGKEAYGTRPRIVTYRQVIGRHFLRFPERMLGPDGQPATRSTVGLLAPAPTNAYRIRTIGREMNVLDRVGVSTDPRYVDYTDEAEGRRLILHVLRDHKPREVAQRTGLPLSTVKGFLRKGRTSRSRWNTYAEAAGKLAIDALVRWDLRLPLPEDPEALGYLYLSEAGRLRPMCQLCGRPLQGRQRKWCTKAHEARARREKATERRPAAICACGCTEPVTSRRYVDAAHRMRASRARRKSARERSMFRLT